MTWKERAVDSIVAAAVAFAVSYVVAKALLAVGGFRGAELKSFVFWSIVLAVIVALVNLAAARLWRRRGGVAVAAIAGLILGVAFTFGVAGILGPWMLAFVFPVGVPWALACVAAYCTVAVLRRRRAL